MSDLFRPPIDRILAELNRQNSFIHTPLTPEMIEIIDPVVFSSNNNQTNTRATLIARSDEVPVQYFEQQTLIYYNRLQLSRILFGLEIPGQASDYTNSREVTEALRDVYLVPISPLDDIALTLVDGTQSMTLFTLTSSIGYYGSAVVPFEIMS